MLSSVLLLDTLEDSRRFTPLKSLHGAVTDWHQWSQWEWHSAYATLVFSPKGVYLRQLDQGLLKPENATECPIAGKMLKQLDIISITFVKSQMNISYLNLIYQYVINFP